VWTGVTAVTVFLTLLATNHVPRGLHFFSADISSSNFSELRHQLEFN
jgi:hypothetical protein